jgi:hypothetical protein
MELLSPGGAEGAAVFELAGGTGLGEVTAEGGEAHHQRSGRTSRVVVLLDDPGTVRFRVATSDVGEVPRVTVLQVAGGDNGLRSSLAGYHVRVEQVETGKGGAR